MIEREPKPAVIIEQIRIWDTRRRRRDFLYNVAAMLALIVLLLLLMGCVTPCPPGQCIGPYDLTLSSHREALE